MEDEEKGNRGSRFSGAKNGRDKDSLEGARSSDPAMPLPGYLTLDELLDLARKTVLLAKLHQVILVYEHQVLALLALEILL